MNPEAQAPGPMLERFREYLRLLARLQIGTGVQAQVDPSDVVQQTLLEAYQQLAQLRGQSQAEITAWLRQILAHNLADAFRGVGRAKRDVARQRSLEAALEDSSSRLQAWLAAEQSSPSQRAERHEEAVRLADALATLPEAQREALVLQHWHGWTLAQIGQHLGRSTAAVAGLLKRGLKQLRQQLEPVAKKGSDPFLATGSYKTRWTRGPRTPSEQPRRTAK
jgi:RNA polymerase sigma-70 factor (ECF subfamily)